MNIIGCATVWGKCIKRVTACHIVHDVLILLMSQVPVLITDHHMCMPGQPFLFVFFQFRSSSMYAECKTRETPTRGRVRGFIAAHTIVICRKVTREGNTWSAQQLVSQILSRLWKWRWSKYVYRNGSFHNWN